MFLKTWLIHLVIPNTWTLTWTWTWSVIVPINLVFQWRLMFDKKLKETSLPDLRLENNDFWKSGSIRTQRTTHKLILVGVVEVDKVRTRTKESRSIDRAETENIKELNARSLDTKVELKSIRLRTKILNQFQDHLLKKDQFVDDLFNIFIIYRINQEPKSGSVVCVRWVRTNPDFSVNISVQITGNEVFNFVSNIRHLED